MSVISKIFTKKHGNLCAYSQLYGEASITQVQMCSSLSDVENFPVASPLLSTIPGRTFFKCRMYHLHFSTLTLLQNWRKFPGLDLPWSWVSLHVTQIPKERELFVSMYTETSISGRMSYRARNNVWTLVNFCSIKGKGRSMTT